jgi:hypothetical protein
MITSTSKIEPRLHQVRTSHKASFFQIVHHKYQSASRTTKLAPARTQLACTAEQQAATAGQQYKQPSKLTPPPPYHHPSAKRLAAAKSCPNCQHTKLQVLTLHKL